MMKPQHRAWALFPLALFLVFLLGACGKEDEAYPSIVTEMACLYTDRNGQMTQMVLDDGTTYDVSGQKLTGYHESALYRGVCGFVPDGAGKAKIYTLYPVGNIREAGDSISEKYDYTDVKSIWRGGAFLNFHLSPMTQGGEQEWAFKKDSVSTNTLGGTTYFISICHDQGDDPQAYHVNYYASMFVDSIAQNRTPQDSINVAVHTFDGLRHYCVSGE